MRDSVHLLFYLLTYLLRVANRRRMPMPNQPRLESLTFRNGSTCSATQSVGAPPID